MNNSERIRGLLNNVKDVKEELRQGQNNYNKLWNMYSETKDKLTKAQYYIKDLEEQLRNKKENGWMNK